MLQSLSLDDLRAAVAELGGTVHLRGLARPVEIYRDALGIPHVRAQSVHDAFWAQGFVHAQDRLWQMDYDRHRAYGRSAEYAGPAALAYDRLLRRFRLESSAQADYAAVNPETRAMLDAYAAGVNAFLQTTTRLPIEYRLLQAMPAPWQPWDACAVFKIRHLFTGGVWQGKLWRARLLCQLGPERTAQLCEGYQPDYPLILPPGAVYGEASLDGLWALRQGADVLAQVQELDAGSNSWVLAGSRTASGAPLLAGDPHRALDTPNVFYQNHVACPTFDAIGFSFPGVPGFSHFGHNQAVAWCITTAMGDYQDLYIERFHPDDASLYEFEGQWRRAERHREVIEVRGGQAVEVEVTVTHHGPIVVGEPVQGHALAFRYTATAAPNAGFNALLPMLRASSAAAFEEAMRPWVDPCNNVLFADVQGTIGYRTRGQIPRRSLANAWLPVPGWTGEHEWQGLIPFEELPHLHNPEPGFFVTANNRIVGDDYPHYLALYYESPFRARRIQQRLGTLTQATAADMAAIHADCLSLPARTFTRLLASLVPLDPRSAQAQGYLQGWDGSMARESVAATLYAVCREHLLHTLVEGLVGPLTPEAFSREPGGGAAHMARLRAQLSDLMQADARSLLPPGLSWASLLASALARAVAWLQQQLGDDMAAWQWGRLHRLLPQHPLAASFPEVASLLNPPAVPMGGDADTVQAASHPVGGGYAVSGTSVARYIFDLADWDRSAWVVPLGSSGHPGSPHYADQLARWAAVLLYPMEYHWDRICAQAETVQRLEPAE